MTSTERWPRWRYVEKGAHVGIACEGGAVTRVAEEPGAILELEGHDGVFVPASMLAEALCTLNEMAKPRRKR